MRMNGFFQNAYVTRNLDSAIAMLRRDHDLGEMMLIDFDTEATTPRGKGPVKSRVALVWVDGLQIELIEPVSGYVEIYADELPEDDSLRFHHIGVRVADMDALRAEATTKGWPVVFQGGGEGFAFTYVDTRATLGHYLEYVYIREDMWVATGGH